MRKSVLLPDRVHSIVFSAALLVTFFSDSLYAQVPVLIGNSVDLSSGLTLQRGGPSVAYNSANNEYLIVWFDLRNQPTTGNDVFGQRLSANGTLLGGNIPIATEVGAQFGAFVAYNSIDNNYLVAWKSQFDGPSSPNFNDAFGRLVSNGGIPLGGAFHISEAGDEISSAYNSTNNEYLVTGRAAGISGQIVSNSGSLVGGGIVISTVGAPAPNGQVIYNPTINEYFATWRDQVDENLKGHRISATGVLIGTPILISPFFPESSSPTASIAFDPANNRYIIVFARFQGMEIWGQLVSSSGALIGSNFLIQTVSSPIETPSVAHSSIDNAFFLVWRDGNNVVGQLLSETGALLGSPLVIVNGTAGPGFILEHPPQTVHNTTTGDFLVVWQDDRNVAQGEQDIFAQLVGIASSTSTTLVYTGDTSGDFHDSVTLSATLTLSETSTPLVNQTITFTIGTQSCTGLTKSTGVASCNITLDQIPGSYTVTADFAATDALKGSSASAAFTITREETTLSYMGDTVIANNTTATLSGVLLEDGVVPIAGRTVVFTIGSGGNAQTCSGKTDAAGVAACPIFPVNQPFGVGVVAGNFSGDAFYLPSSAQATTIIFALLVQGGFVLGDKTAVVGSANVEFWGADWSRRNILSGAGAPNAFKGFASTVTTNPPACGDTWTSRPGNSANPPDTLPPFLGVLVSSTIGMSGSTVSGNVPTIVVVKTNASYAPDPGHSGTGTVVAVYCK
jgi:hypothetical protein